MSGYLGPYCNDNDDGDDEMTIWVYIRTGTNADPLWTVGHYTPKGEWIAETDWGTADEAADRVHYLNGGRSVTDGR